MKWEVGLEGLDDFAQQFWTEVGETKIFAFHGQMGAGKTTTIGALCAAKGISGMASSPTFSIINEYKYSENGTDQSLYHIDLYRLKDEEEIIAAGVEECIFSNAICFVEWPGKAPHLFPENTMHVIIRPLSETVRTVRIESHKEFTINSLEEQL
ncbi:MAG: hypothetical protein JWP88_83 [Flaviaesturariibacter sp.]|nr:hypothetical protein [Flaviaesturariibacter sp.]